MTNLLFGEGKARAAVPGSLALAFRGCQTGDSAIMDAFLNIVFFVFHTAWIGFTCTGWIWRRTRRWHLAAVMLTTASWFGLGLWYGWGYCPCTDWHWAVRERLGYIDPPSYTQLLIGVITGVDPGATMANAATAGTLAAAGVLSVSLNWRDRRTAIARRKTADAPTVES